MQRKRNGRASLVFVGLVLGLMAGCSGDPDYEPTQRRDTSTVTLPANKGIEFKLFMNEGDPVQYTWSSTQRLVYDFHGELEGDKSGAFTSHKTGSASGDSGSLKAPFRGTHGWYWENQNSQSVSVTLTTDGIYDVVGESAPIGRS